MSTGWMQRGACTDADPELFHPQHKNKMALAKRFCKRCPVVNECLDYALSHMDDEGDDPGSRAIGQWGVWGNTIPSERWAVLGRRPSKQAGARHKVAS